MKYSFELEWDELPEDLRREKIEAFIEDMGPQTCLECSGDGTIENTIPARQEAGQIVDEQTETIECENCDGSGEVEPDINDDSLIEEAESMIKAHFPIQF